MPCSSRDRRDSGKASASWRRDGGRLPILTWTTAAAPIAAGVLLATIACAQPPPAAAPTPPDRYVRQPLQGSREGVSVLLRSDDGVMVSCVDEATHFACKLDHSTPAPYGATIVVRRPGLADLERRFVLREFGVAADADDNPQVQTRPAIVLPWRTARPLVGPLRVEHRRFVDDTGVRRVLFTSAFPLLRVYHDDPARGDQLLDQIARAGYQGVRVFVHLGMYANHPERPGAAQDYYAGYEVSLAVARSTIAPLAHAVRARGLRLHLSGDNHWLVPDEALIEHWAALAEALHADGLDDTVAYIDVINEPYRSRFDPEATVRFAERVMGEVKRRLAPAPLMAIGASSRETPEALAFASRVGDVTDIHGTRQPWDEAIRAVDALTRVGEAAGRAATLPFWQGEPTGPGAYLGQSDPAALLGLYAAHAMAGQASVYFCGAMVKLNRPLESCWGFTELPALLAALPEDIGAWSTGPAGAFSRTRGRQVVVLDIEGAGISVPAALEAWTLVTSSGATRGQGSLPPPAPGYKARLVIGTTAG